MVPRDLVMEDWDFLRSTDRDITVPQAAPRMGMTVAALEQALRRARAAGDPRARFTYAGIYAAVAEERRNRQRAA